MQEAVLGCGRENALAVAGLEFRAPGCIPIVIVIQLSLIRSIVCRSM
jgi:hypothetical protein